MMYNNQLFFQMATMISLILLMLLFHEHTCSTENDHFDIYKNIRIASGKLLERNEIAGVFLPHITCLSQCLSNRECLMVVHETTNGSFCALWTFIGIVNYYPVFDDTATLYARRDCKQSAFKFHSPTGANAKTVYCLAYFSLLFSK